jgi:hypothetical protein
MCELYVQVTVHRDKFHKNNQLDASISKMYFCHKTLHVSGIFCAHHQGLSTVHTAIGTFHAGYVTASKQSQVGTQFQPDSAWVLWVFVTKINFGY